MITHYTNERGKTSRAHVGRRGYKWIKKPKKECANKKRAKHTTNRHDVRTTTAEHSDGDGIRRLHRRVGGGGGGDGGGAHGVRRHMVIT